jgi:hypothetical protein
MVQAPDLRKALNLFGTHIVSGSFASAANRNSSREISFASRGKLRMAMWAVLWQHAHRGRKECVGETVFGPKGTGKKYGAKEPVG